MSRVLLIGNYAPDGPESRRHFAGVLAERLLAVGVDARLICPPVRLGKLVPAASRLSPWLGYLDKLLLFPAQLRRTIRREQAAGGGSLIVHLCDQESAIYTRQLAVVPQVVTCHDLLAIRAARGEFPDHPTRWPDRAWQRRILAGLRRARRLTCVSKATLEDVRRLVKPRAGIVDVTELGLHYPFAPMAADAAAQRIARLLGSTGATAPASCGFVLHVGGNHWHKNRLGLLRIYARLVDLWGESPPLVMVGEPLTTAMNRWVAEHHLAARVRTICGCDHEELRALYSRAALLLLPSLYAGFGRPIAEAQTCGCPVVTSDYPPLSEVGGTAASYIDPADETAAAEHVLQVLREPDPVRRERIRGGFDNATRFAIGKMVQRYIGLYHDLSPTGLVTEPRRSLSFQELESDTPASAPQAIPDAAQTRAA